MRVSIEISCDNDAFTQVHEVVAEHLRVVATVVAAGYAEADFGGVLQLRDGTQIGTISIDMET